MRAHVAELSHIWYRTITLTFLHLITTLNCAHEPRIERKIQRYIAQDLMRAKSSPGSTIPSSQF